VQFNQNHVPEVWASPNIGEIKVHFQCSLVRKGHGVEISTGGKELTVTKKTSFLVQFGAKRSTDEFIIIISEGCVWKGGIWACVLVQKGHLFENGAFFSEFTCWAVKVSRIGGQRS
jgi:hypothetical protein